MKTSPRGDPDKIVQTYQSYAHAVVAGVLRSLPRHIDKNDLLAAGELGLVEAAKAFDPSRGVEFKTFAYYRIRGAVYDCLRKMGWFSKGQYQRYKFEMAANEYLKDYSTFAPQPATLSEEFGEIKNLTGSILSCYLLSLEELATEVADQPEHSPEARLQGIEERQRVRECLAQLQDKNRQVLEGYYFQEMTLEEIGQKLGLSKSWVSRIHSKSLEMVRDLLQKSEKKGEVAKMETSLKRSR